MNTDMENEKMGKCLNSSLFRAAAVALASAGAATQAAEITYVTGAPVGDRELLARIAEPWEKETGHTLRITPMPPSTTDSFGQYRLWLAARNSEIDIYETDVVWAPQLADHFVDLTDAAADVAGDHFPSIIESQTVNGALVALPLFTDAPALYFRRDLIEKHGASVPTKWEDLTATAAAIQAAERDEGNSDFWGFVWQGNAYEGLTCDGLEWVKSFGGGQIVEADGTISINNPEAAAAITLAASWIGTISPEGTLSYQEEDSRGIWQSGNALFMRNWPYAYSLGNADDSPIAGKFGIVPLPSGGDHDGSAATLGGWNLAVSRYSENVDAATSLALYLTSPEAQLLRAKELSRLPTIVSLYEHPEITDEQPVIASWKDIFLNAVPRPSAPTKTRYNEVSARFWTAVHNTLSGNGSAAENLELLEFELEEIKGNSW